MSPDVPASVKARLLNEAKRQGEGFELFLVRYACERFLYRLGASRLREQCRASQTECQSQTSHWLTGSG
jgi:hypothetical protein